jgi:hypothetical protein
VPLHEQLRLLQNNPALIDHGIAGILSRAIAETRMDRASVADRRHRRDVRRRTEASADPLPNQAGRLIARKGCRRLASWVDNQFFKIFV